MSPDTEGQRGSIFTRVSIWSALGASFAIVFYLLLVILPVVLTHREVDGPLALVAEVAMALVPLVAPPLAVAGSIVGVVGVARSRAGRRQALVAALANFVLVAVLLVVISMVAAASL